MIGQAGRDGIENLRKLNDARKAHVELKDTGTFNGFFIGALAVMVPPEEWKKALETAMKLYAQD